MEKNFEPLKKLLKEKGLELTKLHEDSINVSQKNGVCLYNYNNKVLIPRNDPIIVMCRGIGIRADGKVVNHPFNRFFNYHEPECDKVDVEYADIFEKLDGSLISVWHTESGWEVTTRGAFYPHEDSHNFKETFIKLFDEFDKLFPRYTYIFELISKDNRIVTKYDSERVVLIGARDLNTDLEVTQERLDSIAADIFVDRPKRYNADDVEECRKLFDQMKDDEEGLVIVDKNFNRFKLKQESYLKMAKIISLKNQDVLDYMLGRVELDSDFTDMPELTEKVEEVKKLYDEVKEYATMIYDNIKHIEDQREFAMHALNYQIRGILFNMRRGKQIDDMDIRYKKLEELHESIIKPEPKKLIVLRGVPCSGKSTWIKENGLELYTLCPDTLRLMYAAPNPTILQDNDATVWTTLGYMLSSRMRNGDFTIIDGAHTKDKSLRGYKNLCSQYGYELEIKRFDITLVEALERNDKREEYKKVPKDVITRMHKQLNPKGL